MKTTITITIDTDGIKEIYDEKGIILKDYCVMIEENVHETIKNWIKDNIEENLIINAVMTNYYDLKMIDAAEDISDYGSIKITYNDSKQKEDEIVMNIEKEKEYKQVKKLGRTIKYEDEVEIPEMQLDDGNDDYNELAEENENKEEEDEV